MKAHEVLSRSVPWTAASRPARSAQLVDRWKDPRLFYMLRYNLAVNHTHLGAFAEAHALLGGVRELVTERGDDNEAPRLNWLQGRIAAGLGRSREARYLLERAMRQFGRRKLWYDVALALLELACLLLHEGKTAEVKALASNLTGVFASQKVHREALAALQLFKDAAEREEADEDLARRVLRFLVRARHDQGLTFES